MALDTVAPVSVSELGSALERCISRRTSGRVRGLRVEAMEAGLMIHGSAPTFHIKQLAVQAIVELFSTTAESEQPAVFMKIEVEPESRDTVID